MVLPKTTTTATRIRGGLMSSRKKVRRTVSKKTTALWTIIFIFIVLLQWYVKRNIHLLQLKSSGEVRVSISKEDNDGDFGKCRVYLAPSSLPDAEGSPAGFGLFSAVPLKKGDRLFPRGEGANSIMTDVLVNQKSGLLPSWARLIFLYPCSNFNIETDDPSVADDPDMSCWQQNMNSGTMGNFHPFLINVDFDDTDVYVDNMLDRRKDPGAGAFSYHMGKTWRAKRDINAGEELFQDYGENWFFDGQLGQAGIAIPRYKNYVQAAMLTKKFIRRTAGEPTQADLNNFVSRVAKIFPRTASLLPTKLSDFVSMTKNAATDGDYRYGFAIARRTVLNRSAKWVEENGRCLDNVVPGKSTIPQAGRGAFASRFAPRGSVVIPAPTLLQITNKTTLDVFHHSADKTESVGEAYTKQIVYNYCIGHEKSSMVLCPGTNANLINHCSSRGGMIFHVGSCDKRGPNAELRWATEFDPATKEWLKLSIQEIDNLVLQKQRGLSFEVVALRDIYPGEEIFIDYGPAWENAWKEHVETWRPPPQDDEFVSITTMNNDINSYLRTEEELKGNSYPSNAQLGCFHKGFYHRCKIIERKDSSNGNDLQYRVILYAFVSTVGLRYEWYYDESSIETVMSSRDIQFFHGFYSSDEHLSGTFRHHIGVRDDMWPDQWKNL